MAPVTAPTRTVIPADEAAFHPHSFADPDGRLFTWRGALYRGVTARRAEFFRGVLAAGTLRPVMHRGLLVDTETTPLSLAGYALVLRHRRVRFVSYPTEWCPAMFRDVALAYLDLVRHLVALGLTVKDAHPWNLLVDRCAPVFVDFTSLAPCTEAQPWAGSEKFARYYVRPLVLMAHRHGRLARALMDDYDGIGPRDVAPWTGRAREPVRRALRRLRAALARGAGGTGSSLAARTAATLARLAADVRALRLPAPTAADDDDATPSDPVVDRLLAGARPASVLVIGGSALALRAAATGAAVVAMDHDEDAAARLYARARAAGASVLPIVMDVARPTPSIGFGSHHTIAASERYRADLVLSDTALSHALLRRSVPVDRLAAGLAAFATRRLAVAFRPTTGGADDDRRPAGWYSLETCVRAFAAVFARVTLAPAPGGGTWIVCER